MTDKPLVALIDGDNLGSNLTKHKIRDIGGDYKHFRDYGNALESTKSQKYDLILLELQTTTGRFEEMDEEVGRIIGRVKPGSEPPEIGLYWIKKVSEEESPNRETPIVVHTTYHPRTDSYVPKAKERAREAGAVDYLHKDELPDLDAVLRKHLEL